MSLGILVLSNVVAHNFKAKTARFLAGRGGSKRAFVAICQLIVDFFFLATNRLRLHFRHGQDLHSHEVRSANA